MRMSCSAAALALALVPLAAHAQNEETPEAPAGRTDAVLEGLSFELEADEGGAQAAVQMGGFTFGERPDSEGNVDQTSWNWLLKATVPVSSEQNLLSRKSLDSMAHGAKLGLSIGFFMFESAIENLNRGRFRRVMAEAREKCREAKLETGDERNCEQFPDDDFAAQYVGWDRLNYALYSGAEMWRAGVDVAVGFDRFEFVLPATLTAVEESKLQASAAAFVTWYPPDARSTLILRSEYQNAFEARDAEEVCKPVVVDRDADCVQDARRSPKHVERLNLSLEYRRVFDLTLGGGMIAISPRATYDALSDEFEAELPLYLVPEDEDAIVPGLVATYSSEEGDVSFGAFLKSSF